MCVGPCTSCRPLRLQHARTYLLDNELLKSLVTRLVQEVDCMNSFLDTASNRYLVANPCHFDWETLAASGLWAGRKI